MRPGAGKTQNEGMVVSAPDRKAWHLNGTNDQAFMPVEAFPRALATITPSDCTLFPKTRKTVQWREQTGVSTPFHIRVIREGR